ncbi:MAG: cytochrome c3 family protein [Desulfobacterales bacterium]|nr:cytochrome c3 family protein [Desulfobacterales bacterium]
MKTARPLLRQVGILVAVALFSITGLGAQGVQKLLEGSEEIRADIIPIDSMRVFGRLERPEVVFLHDKHTDAIEKQNKDCQACHQMENNRLVPKFKRLKDTDKQAVMDIYHTNCIGCHKETSATGKKAGPIETCGECHPKKNLLISSRQPISFDHSLHYRHAEANKDQRTNKGDCALCHHEYNEKTKKLFYAKEKEGSCRYCHKKTTEENRSSMKLASHDACIDCHRKKVAVKIESGPVKCMGCHDHEMQKKIEKIEVVPRMERKQPDFVLIRVKTPGPNKEGPSFRMNPAPFNHKAHETYNNTCIVCHHESLQSCVQCHTSEGAKEGKFIKLESAMHLKAKEQSCLGCHETNQRKPECAACHAFLAKDRRPESTTCQLCHMNPLSGVSKNIAQDERQIAEMLLNSRKTKVLTYNAEDIPEKVVIKALSEKYEAVELPHRKIIHTLLNNIKDSKLAGYYHSDQGTICQGCHHNSPVAKKPPNCGSCHGKPFDESNAFRPGLMGAFHQQCMGCHQVLKLVKPTSTGCTDCHKLKRV